MDSATSESLAFTPEPSQPSTTRRIFIGPLGLRAGWSLLIYISLVVSIIVGVNGVHSHIKAKQKQATAEAHRLHPEIAQPQIPKPDPNAPQPLLTGNIVEGVALTVFLALSFLMARIERRRVAAFGLAGHHPFRRFFVGAFWGITALTLLIVILHSFHLLVFDTRLLHGPAILGWGAAQLVSFFLVGVTEEYLFRGYLQFTLTRGLLSLGNVISRPRARTIAFWSAGVVTSALFLIAHTGNGGEDKLGLLHVFLFGLVCLVALWRTGSLWWAIGFHNAWDWGQSFLYGVPDSGGLVQGRLFATHALGNPLISGGTVGPEGSALITPLLLLTLLVLYFTHPSPQPSLEQSTPAQSTPTQSSFEQSTATLTSAS
jgi:membrane protease YdiL (CAAX protease family)